MKQAWNDLKSFVTVVFTIALVALVFITIFKSEEMFKLVFVLFTNIATAIFTYFFTKRKIKYTTKTDNEKEV